MSIDASSLLLLLNWMSPTFPTGSFAYSHGMETAIADGRLQDAADVEEWIADLITSGSGWCDAVLFARCWQEDVEGLNVLALALAGSAARWRETVELGASFAAAASVWTGEVTPEVDIAYPVAAGSACSSAGIAPDQALLAFLQGFCAAQVSVAVRLVPLGQTAGLQVLRNLAPVVKTVAARAATSMLDDLGSATIAAEVAAMRHETLQPRIFRT